MIFKSVLTAALAFGSLTLATPVLADDLVVGGPGQTGDCAPFGCVIRYQQAYSANLFTSGPINIHAITFYYGGDGFSNVGAGNYNISFSTAATGVGSLSPTFADNIGADSKTFFNGALSGTVIPTLVISGASFRYDPSMGDLLMNVTKSSPGDFTTYQLYRDDFAGFQRVYDFTSTTTGNVDNNYGLVTGFNYTLASVPEAASWAMMIAGFGLIGAAMRRQRGLAIA